MGTTRSERLRIGRLLIGPALLAAAVGGSGCTPEESRELQTPEAIRERNRVLQEQVAALKQRLQAQQKQAAEAQQRQKQLAEQQARQLQQRLSDLLLELGRQKRQTQALRERLQPSGRAEAERSEGAWAMAVLGLLLVLTGGGLLVGGCRHRLVRDRLHRLWLDQIAVRAAANRRPPDRSPSDRAAAIGAARGTAVRDATKGERRACEDDPGGEGPPWGGVSAWGRS